jgi:hypothetical protein
MIFCDGICIVTVRSEILVIVWNGAKIIVIPASRTPVNLPRLKTTPRSYCISTRIELSK